VLLLLLLPYAVVSIMLPTLLSSTAVIHLTSRVTAAAASA
jgi:hypothetical protein